MLTGKVAVITGAGRGIGREIAILMASRAAAGHFRSQQHGSFIHFTSTSGLIGNLGQANYSAAKMGIVGLSKSIALDMQRFQVRSNCIAPLVTYLASDKARHISGQIFAVRNNEIFLISQPRPVRSVHRAEGWTPESVADHAMPALEKSFYSLDVSADVFSWDPI